MTREESLRHFEREVGLVFQQEWQRLRGWIVVKAFMAGALTASAAWTVARLI